MGANCLFVPLCPGCPPGLRFLDFLGRWAWGFFTGPSEAGGLEEIGRISCEKRYLPFKFSNSGLENFNSFTQLKDEFNRCFRISIRKGSGFFPCHAGS